MMFIKDFLICFGLSLAGAIVISILFVMLILFVAAVWMILEMRK